MARLLELRRIRDAVLVPRSDPADTGLGAGVVARRGRALVQVPRTGLRRRGREYVAPPPVEGVVPTRHLDAAIYGGFLLSHYGHFLLESLGRLWMRSVDHVAPIVWIAETARTFERWMLEMLDVVGIGGERIVVDHTTGPLAVDELLVPDPGFEVQRFLHPWLADRLAVRQARPQPTKVWLSRSRLAEGQGVTEAPDIEARLAARGWRIVHPELLSVHEQVEVLGTASHVAGIEGSAFHSLLLVRGFSGTVDVFTRQRNTNFEVIAATTGWDQVRHELPGGVPTEWQRPEGWRDVHWHAVDVDATVELLEGSIRRRLAT